VFFVVDVFVVVERHAVALGDRRVLVIVVSRRRITPGRSEPEIKSRRTCLLQLSRFFEATVATFFHGHTPEPSELTLEASLPVAPCKCAIASVHDERLGPVNRS